MILSDYECATCGIFEALAPSDCDAMPCPECGERAPWSPSPVHGRVRLGEVVRGKVAKPDSPMFLDTRSLGEGEPLREWKARRAKLYAERRHREGKEL